jgi:DNA polymerase III sliding clamp (beta) subunit (PCNA family)
MIIAKDALSIINAKVELMFIAKAWIHFATEDGVIFSIRKIEGAFPYDAIFKQLEDTSTDLISIKMPPDISEAIETTGIFADDEDFPILITVSNNLMQFEAKSEMGEGEYESVIEYEGDKFSFRINSTLIKYILGVTNEMEIDKEHRKAVFNAGDFWYVMPVRVLG